MIFLYVVACLIVFAVCFKMMMIADDMLKSIDLKDRRPLLYWLSYLGVWAIVWFVAYRMGHIIHEGLL